MLVHDGKPTSDGAAHDDATSGEKPLVCPGTPLLTSAATRSECRRQKLSLVRAASPGTLDPGKHLTVCRGDLPFAGSPWEDSCLVVE